MFQKVFKSLISKCCSEAPEAEFIIEQIGQSDEAYSVHCGEGKITLRGGRKRAIFYAIYDYFERAYGVTYHWDGDIFPAEKKPFVKLSFSETPRFEYRGLRYFAHRGLHRFQAEMWSESDWEAELDWLLKKRFNLFMLRIGNEDLFPLAFPEICPWDENDSGCPQYSGFDDRTPISTLKERFLLRKRVCEMAAERDLIQPVDCGTVTHWYSRTPKSFLEQVNPTFLSQTTSVYADKGGLVWDIRDEKNLENYFKLTKAYTDNLGCNGLFHTIGLAERLFSADRAENLRLKKLTYSKICDFLKKSYRDSKLLVASWDFSFYWQNGEVQELLDELDPEQCIIFDYTSDTTDEHTNFLNWGVVGKFPYIFGIFQGYEPSNGIRNDYDRIERRLNIAAADSFCKGFVTWQELSHGDNFMLEYVARNAWCPQGNSRAELLPRYCRARFGSLAGEFEEIYNTLYPITRLFTWGGDKENPAENFFNDYTYNLVNTPVTRTPMADSLTPEYKAALKKQLAEYKAVKAQSPKAGAMLKALKPRLFTEQQRREWYDLERSRQSAEIHFEIIHAGLLMDEKRRGRAVEKELADSLNRVLSGQKALTRLLSEHGDYSLAETMERLERDFAVNPYFRRRTIRENTETEYCRSCIYEIMRDITVPETERLIEKELRAETINSIKLKVKS